uniref:Uncharacterized protein n=1 Tax=Anguilla anguilla TaxID=7936 RepID=A0A0E9VWM2_ANGAN
MKRGSGCFALLFHEFFCQCDS